MFPALFGQVHAGRNPQLGRQRLDEHAHEVADHHHPQERIAELSSGLDVGGEVTGVHVGHAGNEGRTEEGQEPGRPCFPGAPGQNRRCSIEDLSVAHLGAAARGTHARALRRRAPALRIRCHNNGEQRLAHIPDGLRVNSIPRRPWMPDRRCVIDYTAMPHAHSRSESPQGSLCCHSAPAGSSEDHRVRAAARLHRESLRAATRITLPRLSVD